jgi:hypothetical protein
LLGFCGKFRLYVGIEKSLAKQRALARRRNFTGKWKIFGLEIFRNLLVDNGRVSEDKSKSHYFY